MVFSQPGRSQQIWQQLQIQDYWGHHDRPSGQRFLGSIRISKNVGEQLLDIVRSSFAWIQPFTFSMLEERFGRHDPQHYWIKITTLALSEYAYYDEGHTGFWEGVCDRLGLPRTQGVENTLRAVLKKGIKLLGLVETQQSNYYVSTLWLQSGIPQQNLEHFARLLQDISQEYGWWEIVHAEPADLSQMMYEFCWHHHPQWGKLLTFLKSSYAEDDEAVEPISGQLLQGIAIVAQELERRGLSPTILQDSQQQEQFLQNYCLPNTFFLRSWDNLIQVLTPQEQSQTTRRGIIGLRKKSLFLRLDSVDSMDIQLYLPPQLLWQSGWNQFRGTYCQIREHGWETTLPDVGGVEIPALVQTVNRVCQRWTWQLRSHTGGSLTEWHCEGITPNLPVLIFDAWTGDRLLFGSELKGSTEIICFFASSTQVELSDGIELLDGFVPCSIAGWRGQQFLLTTAQAQLTVRFAHGTQSFLWSQVQANYPQLRGLKLQGRQPVYLDVPAIWYPSLPVSTAVKILVEDLTHRAILTAPDETLQIAAHPHEQNIQLSQWITRSGAYAVQLWTQEQRWSAQFEVKSSFELNQPPDESALVVYDRTQTPIKTPLQVTTLTDFWLSELTLHGLWAMEEVTLLLTDGAITQRYQQQAAITGVLTINLAAWRDVLPESNGSVLSYQRQGEAPHRLLEMVSDSRLVSQTWANQAIHLSGLHSGKTHTLTFWNVLTPQNQPLRHTVLVSPDQDAVTVSLNDLWGLFHVQLECSSGAAQSLGWWSGIQTMTNMSLPDELSDDRFEYCMNIFENQSVEAFSAKVSQLDLDIEVQAVNRAIASLENDPCHLPDWIDQTLLKQKLQALLSPSSLQNISPPSPSPQSLPKELVYLIELQSNTSGMRRAFNQKFATELKKARLESSIQLIKDAILRDLIRVKLNHQEQLPTLRDILQNIESKIHTPITLTEWSR